MVRNFWPIWVMLFYFFFCSIIKVNLFCIVLLYYYVWSLHFHLTKSLLVPYAYVSIESGDCILLSLFELKVILSISSVQTLCLSLFNLHYVCNIDLLFFYKFFMTFFFNTIYINFIFKSNYIFLSNGLSSS